MNTESESALFIELKQNFSSRLLALLTKHGYKSDRVPYYVDVNRFADEIDITPTMLRRYLSGEAIPRFKLLEKIATMFAVDAMWLYCGYKPTENTLNKALLRQILLKAAPAFLKLPIKHENVVEYVLDIYEKIAAIDATNELEQARLIGWMMESFINYEQEEGLTLDKQKVSWGS